MASRPWYPSRLYSDPDIQRGLIGKLFLHRLSKNALTNDLNTNIIPQLPMASVPPGRHRAMKAQGENLALVNCIECGKQVSDRAPSCPHCGNPDLSSVPPRPDISKAAPALTPASNLQGRGEPLRFKQTKSERNGRRSRWPSVLLVGAVLVVGGYLAYRYAPSFTRGSGSNDYSLDSHGYIAEIGPEFFQKPKTLLLVDDATGRALESNSIEFRIADGEMTLCNTAGQCGARGQITREGLRDGTRCDGIATTAPELGVAKRYYVICISPKAVKQFVLPEGDRPGEIPADTPYASIVTQASNGSVLTVNSLLTVKKGVTEVPMEPKQATQPQLPLDKCAVIDQGEAQTRQQCQGGNFNACRDIQGWVANRIMEGCTATRSTSQTDEAQPPPSSASDAATPEASARSSDSIADTQDIDLASHERTDSMEITVRSAREPRYPPNAFRSGIEGTVRVELDVDEEGNATNATVLTSSGNADLDRAALEAARQWKFNPATTNGKPVGGRIVVPVTFALN